jgi:L-serine dehydratase
MGFLQDDPRLCDSLALARAAGISYTFKEVRLRDAHPNTVTLDLTGASGVHVFVRAASLGGGAILIQEIDGLPVRVSGDAPTLIIVHRDTPGVIAKISGALADAGLNIANMQVSREAQGRGAISVLELDACASESTITALRAQQGAGRSPASFGAAGQSPALNDIIRVTWMCG